MSNTYVWSDLHISHKNLAEKWRMWAGGTIEAHNDLILQRWNAMVKPHDVVWLVGDAVMGKRAESLEIAKRLHGEIHLIPGNHDNVHSSIHHKTPEKAAEIRAMYEKVFIIEPEAVNGASLGLDSYVLVTHFPWAGTEDHAESDRSHLEKYNPVREDYDPFTVLVHGHTHQERIYGDMSVHVGVDSWPEGPVRVDILQQFIDSARAAGTEPD